ncbi:hypothetical protein CAPTEDRAFT_210923 [Capitella teleta]|uniref:WSC domain-containing protein n=1 Tax=Capitella teleta TaxID=283909 RepID=R7V6H7_CAPTE|nr:hypothetical protein CAPTEDRAFT_210923 [Capitella teleta]|eukprot:ELU14468.1 hypothetical protein CAPTEDRAFT_210923 [Capitella teleta]
MKSFVWIKLSQKVSQALLISAMLSDISFAQNHHWTTASALCTNRSSQLPDLSSVRNGSLLSKLEVGQSTWINAWIGRGPWKWHSLDQKLHPNQGCFTLENPFSTLPHFTLKSPGWNQIECITFCQERQFAFTAMSMQKNELHCYCGNDVPLKRTTQDGYCKEICKNGQHICGFAGYARVVTGEGRPLPPTKAATADFRWTSDYGNNTNKWCAALQYVRTIGDYYSPMLARSDCRVDKKAVCVKNSEVSHIVSSHLMSWFEAQKFCHDLIKSTERLSSDMAYALLQANATTPGEEYWTQLSSLYLNSFNSSGMVIGAVVGGIMVVIIAAVLVAFLLRNGTFSSQKASGFRCGYCINVPLEEKHTECTDPGQGNEKVCIRPLIQVPSTPLNPSIPADVRLAITLK